MKFMKQPVIVKKTQVETASDIRIKKGLPPKISGKAASTKTYSTTNDDQGTPKVQRQASGARQGINGVKYK